MASRRASRTHFEMVTSVTAFTRLFARTNWPSFVTDVLLTMLPPPGTAQLWNFALLGSNRTTVFGFDPDSLYQIASAPNASGERGAPDLPP